MPETQYSLSEKHNLKQPILSDKERFALHQQSIKNPSLDTITSSVHNSSEIIRTQLPNNNRHLFDTSSNSHITPNTASPISSILFHSQNDTPQIPPSSLHDPLHSVTSSFPINAKIELYTHTSSLNPVTVSFSLSPNSKEPQRYNPSLHSPLNPVADSFLLSPNSKPQRYNSSLHPPLNPVADSFPLSPNSKEPQRYNPSLHSPLNPVADSFPLNPNSKPQRYNSSLHPPLNPVADSFPLSPNSKEPQRYNPSLHSPLNPVADSFPLSPSSEPQRYNPSLHSPLNSVVRSFPLNPNNKFHKTPLYNTFCGFCNFQSEKILHKFRIKTTDCSKVQIFFYK